MNSIYATSTSSFGLGIDIYETATFKINLTNLNTFNKSITFNYDIDLNIIDNQIGSPELIKITPSYKLLFSNTDYTLNNTNLVDIFNNSTWVDTSTYHSNFMPKDVFFSRSYIYNCGSYSFNLPTNFNYCYLVLVWSEDNFDINDTYSIQFLANDTTITTLSDSYDSGYKQGNNVGYTNGYNEGYYQGNTEGYESGYRVGYDNGYTVGFNEDNNFTDLFISIGETPVNTFKQMLNFDILGINVAQFVLSLFTLFIVVAGIKKLL